MLVGISLDLFLVTMTMVYILLVIYMLQGWFRIPYFRPKQMELSTSVSVLIAARNEESNIGRTLEAILEQDFPQRLLEIIVVDDHSTDQTAAIVSSYSSRGVKLLKLSEGDKLNSYKKLAISKAIEQASGKLIVTTDADCRMGKDWLRTIVAYFEETGAYMVSSPVAYSEEKSYFERIQTLEFLYLIGLGAAGIGNKHPTTCNGANLAYQRELFYEMGGFKGIDNLASGDDELFLHKVAEKYASKIGFCKAREAIVYTDAKPNLAAFINQRRRWASKSTKYRNKSVVALGVNIWLFNVSLFVGTIHFIIALPQVHFLFVLAVGMKVVIELLFILPLLRLVKRHNLLLYLLPLSLIHVMYLVYIGLAGNVGKYDWKGRKVH